MDYHFSYFGISFEGSEKEIDQIKKQIKKLLDMRIPNINNISSALLIKHFDNIENLRKATMQELQEIEGIGYVKAYNLYNKLKVKLKGSE